jgi:hypothetical protein
MELNPAKGLKVKVNAEREVVFGEESIDVRKVSLPKGDGPLGILTGTTIAGYCEVEMPALDGKKHWYPIDGLEGAKGEKIVEEEIQIDEDPDDGSEDDSEE